MAQWRKWNRWAAAAASVAVVTVGAPGAHAQAEDAPAIRLETHRLEPDQQRELDHLMDDLRDARLDAERRKRAALILLERNWPAANSAMRRLLLNPADPSTQRAIAQAVAAADLPDPQLIEPLFNLFTSDDPALRADAAAALGRFDDAPLTERLIATAADVEAEPTLRLGAIRALSEQRRQDAAAALVKLVDAEDEAIRAGAFKALARLTGRDDIGEDAATWRAYVNRIGELPADRWLAMLMRNLSGRNAQLADDVTVRTARLTDAFSRLYTAAAEAQRQPILAEMLTDEIVAIRRLALDLIERRVLNAQAVDEALRGPMRARLTDTSAAVRSKAALLLRDLKDEPGAELAVRLLLAESDPAVQTSYLSLLGRVPMAEAVEPALMLLGRKSTRAAAAGALVAAAEAGLLEPDQAERAVEAARAQLAAGATPDPAMVHLLGRLGEEADAATLTGMLAHELPELRMAAAQEIARDRWPIAPLLAYLDDEALRAVATGAVGKRGQSLAALQALLAAEPEEVEQRTAWRQAAEACAGRLGAADVAALDEALRSMDQPHPLHEALLASAAAAAINGGVNGNGAGNGSDASDPAADGRRVEATLRLADLYRRTNQPAKAKAALSKLTERADLAPSVRRRLALAELRLMLTQGLVDDAVKKTTDILAADSGAAPDVLADAWLDEAEQAVVDERPSAAGRLLVRVETLLGEKITRPTRDRMTELVARIREQTPTPTPPTPPAGPELDPTAITE